MVIYLDEKMQGVDYVLTGSLSIVALGLNIREGVRKIHDIDLLLFTPSDFDKVKEFGTVTEEGSEDLGMTIETSEGVLLDFRELGTESYSTINIDDMSVKVAHPKMMLKAKNSYLKEITDLYDGHGYYKNDDTIKRKIKHLWDLNVIYKNMDSIMKVFNAGTVHNSQPSSDLPW